MLEATDLASQSDLIGFDPPGSVMQHKPTGVVDPGCGGCAIFPLSQDPICRPVLVNQIDE